MVLGMDAARERRVGKQMGKKPRKKGCEMIPLALWNVAPVVKLAQLACGLAAIG
jgi:hypothetical protein